MVKVRISSVKHYVSEYIEAQQRLYDIVSQPCQKWKPPRRGFVKVNFNGALDRKVAKGGIGIVIRDEKGKIMGAKVTNSLYFNDPFFDEAKAVLYALVFAYETRFQKIEVECDALSIKKQIQEVGAIIPSLEISLKKQGAKLEVLVFSFLILLVGMETKWLTL